MQQLGLQAVLKDFDKFQKDLKGYESGIGGATRATEEMASRSDRAMQALGTAITGGIGVALAAMAAIGAAAVASGKEYEAAQSSIIRATGASGDALNTLMDDFRAMRQLVPGSAEAASSAIGELNTRLGLSGQALQEVAQPLLEMTNMMGGDATRNAQLLTRTMGDWGVAVDDAALTMDKFFAASQATGSSVESLMSQVVQFGAPLRLMGFSLEESIAMFGKWEKEGVNAELVMGSLRIAAAQFAEEGRDLAGGLQETIATIAEMENESEALAMAMDVFGRRAGPDMAAAIREGRFSIEEYLDVIGNADGAILSTAESSRTMGERMQLMGQRVFAALEPLGKLLFDIGEIILNELEGPLMTLADELHRAFADPAVQEGVREFATNLGTLAQFLVKAVEAASFFNQQMATLEEKVYAIEGPLGTILQFFHGIGEQATSVGAKLSWVSDQFQKQAENVRVLADAGMWLIDSLMDTNAALDESVHSFETLDLASEDLLFSWQETTTALADRTWLEDVAGMSGEHEAYMQRMAAQTAEAAAQMEAAWAVMSESMVPVLMAGLSEVEAIHEKHYAKLEELETKHLADREEAAFKHQLAQLEARAGYEAERMRLIEAGKADELASLDAKFEAAAANTDHAYAQQEAMAEMHYIQQQIVQQEAYLAELETQHQKAMLAIATQALEYDQKMGIVDEGENVLLQIIRAGADAQLLQQIDHASSMIKVSAELAEGQIENAVKTVEAIQAAYAQNTQAARDTIGGLRKDFGAMRENILAGARAPYTPADFGFTPASKAAVTREARATGGAAGKAAKDNAVKVMADVAKSIEGGVASALKAIEGLVDFELPEGVEQGLNRFADFVAMAVERIYAVFDDPALDLKTKIDSFAEYLAPLTALLGLLGTPLDLAVPEEEPPWELWGQWLFRSIERALEVLHSVRALISDEMLKEAASIMGDLSAVTGLFGVSMGAMRELVADDWPDLGLWGERLAAMFVRGIDVLQFLRGYISDKGLEAAVGIADSLATVASLFGTSGVSAMREIVAEEFPDLSEWGARLAAMFVRGIDVLHFLRGYIEDKALEAAVGIADSLGKMASLFSISGVDAMRGITETEFPDLDAWGARLAAMLVRGIEVLQYMRGYIEDKGLEAAVGIADSLGKVASLFGIGGIEAMNEIVKEEWPDLEQWGARLFAMFRRGVEVLRAVRGAIADDVLAAAVSIADDLKKVSDMFGIDGIKAMQELVDAKWPDLELWGQRLYRMIMRAIDVIKTVRGRLSDQAVMDAAKIAEHLTKIAGLFGVKLAVSMPRVDFVRQVQRFAKALEDGLEILAETLLSIGADPRWSGQLEGLAKIAEQITQIVGVLDIAKMFSEIQLKRPPQSQIRSIAEDLIEDLRDVTPILREGLQEIAEMWGETFEGLELPVAIDFAGELAGVFGALRDMATAMGDLVGMATGTDATMPTGAALVNVIRRLKGLVTSALPEIDLMRIAFDDANDKIIESIETVMALFDNLSQLGLLLQHIADMQFDPMALADSIGGIRSAIDVLSADEPQAGQVSETPRTMVGGDMAREPVNLNLMLNGTITVETLFDGEKYVTRVEAADLFNAALAEAAAGIP